MTLEGWSRLATAIRQGDLTGAAILASHPLRIVRFDRMLILEIAVPPQPAPSRLHEQDEPRLTSRKAGCEEMASLQRVFPHSAHRYAGRFDRGDECLLVELAGSPIAMGWIGLDPGAPAELGCRVHLPEGGCWEYDIFVLAEHRMRGAFAFLMLVMFEDLSGRGRTKLYAAVDHLNTVSRAAHARLGYTTAAILDRLVLAGRPRHRVTWPAGERSWLERPAEGLPVLRLR